MCVTKFQFRHTSARHSFRHIIFVPKSYLFVEDFLVSKCHVTLLERASLSAYLLTPTLLQVFVERVIYSHCDSYFYHCIHSTSSVGFRTSTSVLATRRKGNNSRTKERNAGKFVNKYTFDV
jgi:hypothetical protein